MCLSKPTIYLHAHSSTYMCIVHCAVMHIKSHRQRSIIIVSKLPPFQPARHSSVSTQFLHTVQLGASLKNRGGRIATSDSTLLRCCVKVSRPLAARWSSPRHHDN